MPLHPVLASCAAVLSILSGPAAGVLPQAGGGPEVATRGSGAGKAGKIRVECLDGSFEEPLVHDVSTFQNPPKSGFYNAVHMSLIPKGRHRGAVLTFDIDPTHFQDEGNERGTWVQRSLPSS